MARVLYGVMGNTNGHIMRTLSIISRMPEHEFHVVGGGRVVETLRGLYPVHEVPVLRTVHRKQSVSLPLTIRQIASRVVEIPKVKRGILKLIGDFQPDLAICDREFFLPHAASEAGLRCLSVDHSHVLKACRYPVPGDQKISWSLAMLNDYLFFDITRHNLVVSFFHPPLRPSRTGKVNELWPAVLRRGVSDVKPRQGDYIFVYQTSPTFKQLIESLRQVKRPVVIYGFLNEHRTEGNLTFKPYEPRAILEDLSGCAYAVVNGGHNLLCEAFYYGKPALCFPVAMLFEQFINAWHVRSLGYGDFSTSKNPAPELFGDFERHLPEYTANVVKGFRDGTEQVVQRVRELIAGKVSH